MRCGAPVLQPGAAARRGLCAICWLGVTTVTFTYAMSEGIPTTSGHFTETALFAADYTLTLQ